MKIVLMKIEFSSKLICPVLFLFMCFSNFFVMVGWSSLGHHDFDKLLIVDLPVTVNICLANHLVNLLVGQLLAEIGHHMAELCSRDETVLILVKHAEGLLQLLLRISVFHLARHEVQEFWEINGTIPISINLVYHVLQLSLSWVLPKWPHHGSKFLGCNTTWIIWTGKSWTQTTDSASQQTTALSQR